MSATSKEALASYTPRDRGDSPGVVERQTCFSFWGSGPRARIVQSEITVGPFQVDLPILEQTQVAISSGRFHLQESAVDMYSTATTLNTKTWAMMANF
jgi:hypothetical protein